MITEGMTIEQLKAELARVEGVLKQAQAAKRAIPEFRVSEKGALSVYNLGRFPVTLYAEQWEKILDLAPELRVFIAAHSELKRKTGAAADAN
jgi:hypothetical protein